MDDLSDGVNKLQEFSSVLSSVTRSLDKNVRRLEDQFTKANSSLKDMKEAVQENREVTTKLRAENDAQLRAMQDAVSLATNFEGSSLHSSEFLLDPHSLKDIRSSSIVKLEAIESKNEEDVHHKAGSANDHKSWMRLVDEFTTLSSRQLGEEVNEKVHMLNRTLLKPKKLTREQEIEERKMTDAERAKDTKRAIYPFPELDKNSTLSQAMSAIIQRMYRLESAVTLQSGVNEALVKIIRDDTHMEAVYNNLIDNIVDVEKVQRELATDNAKLRSALAKLGDHVESYEKSMAELARGGRLRIDKRHKRGERVLDIDGNEIVTEHIEWGLDAYTVEESDILSKRLAVVEAQLSANGAVGVALRRIGNDIETLQTGMIERQEAEEAMKKALEENSSNAGILKKKIQLSKERWLQVVEDIKFGIGNFMVKREKKEAEAAAAEEAEGNQEEEEDEEEETEKPKRPLPVLLQKLSEFCETVEKVLVNSFIIHENLDDTLQVLCPQLDALTLSVEDIAQLDAALRLGDKATVDLERSKQRQDYRRAHKLEFDDEDEEEEEEFITLGDVLTINRDFNLKPCLQSAVNASVPIIDELVDKIGMRRRIEKIEAASVSQDVLDAIDAANKDVQKQLKMKANKDDVAAAMAKRVLKSDINRLRELVVQHIELNETEHAVIDQIVDEAYDLESVAESSVHSLPRSPLRAGSSMMSSNAGKSNVGVNMNMNVAMGGGGLSNAQVQELSTRIELLLKHMQELQTSCQTFIPRDEVQEAMKAVLYEIKVIKMNTVNINKFKEVTDLKADRDEMNNLMKLLNDALGDMMGMNVSSAAKQRCLLCDKPTSSVSHRGETDRERSPSPPRTRGSAAIGSQSILSTNQQSSVVESIPEDKSPQRPSTSQPRLSSSASTSKLSDSRAERLAMLADKAATAKARITSEITILKNSVDLPPIDPNTLRNQNTAEKRGSDTYKARVRTSGGAGGPIQ